MAHALGTITLSSGLALAYERLEGVRTAALCWLLPAGTSSEPSDRLGTSAMGVEMLMRGAGELDSRAHADAFDRLGASRSASNATHSLAISSTCLGERLGDALPLVASMVLEPRFEPGAFGSARALCLQAIESLRDDPQERAALGARERHLPTPINRSSLGKPEGLEALSPAELSGWWSSRARPRGSVLGVAGAIDPEDVARRLDSLLGSWSGTAAEPTADARTPRGYAHEEEPTDQVHIVAVHDAPPEIDPKLAHEPNQDALLERVVVSVLSGGMSGRLFTEVREKRGLCYSVHAGYRGDRGYGLVSAYVGTTRARAQESLDVLAGELRRINEPGGEVTRDEFERAVVGMRSGLVFSGESTAARAGAVAGDQRRFARARTLEELIRRIDAITLEEVNAYVGRRRLGRWTIHTVGPVALRVPAGL